VTTLQAAEVAGNTSNVDVDQQQLIESTGGDSLPDVPLPDVPLHNVPLPDLSRTVQHPDGSPGEG
jgi:hypothetical protein